MKGFLILLAIGLTACDKLDRTYLPPPGAKSSGGSAGDIQTPFELPKETFPSGTLIADNGLPTLGGINSAQPGFSERTTKTFDYFGNNIPTTTTSYAFSQTSTLPSIETYKTTGAPINAITGLPVQYSSQNPINFGYSTTLDSNSQPDFTPEFNAPSPVANMQPGFDAQGKILNYARPSFGQNGLQLESQYQGQYQNIIPGSTQAPRLSQTPTKQDQSFNEYLDKINSKPGIASVPSAANSQDTTVIPTGSTQYGPSFDGTQNIFASSQNVIPVQQIQVNKLSENGNYNLPSYGLNQQDISTQQYPRNKSLGPFVDSKNLYQPGSTSSTIASEYPYQSGISSSTPIPGGYSSTPYPSSTNFNSRPLRPQAENDKNAVILNFENTRSPNGYSYSYDTSNGIHADESGIIDNGTKARGGYSYTGDDGKIYTITYTADENGFQPHGDHLPTPPPVPEAIQKVIEQAIRDKEAGISDDGSYDEAKYGDITYQVPKSHYGPKIQHEYVNTLHDSRGKSGFQISDDVSNAENQKPQLSNVGRNDKSVQIIDNAPPVDSVNFGQKLAQYSLLKSDKDNTNSPLSYIEGYPASRPMSRMSTTIAPLGYPNSQDVEFNNNQEQNIDNHGSVLSNRPGKVTSTNIDTSNNNEDDKTNQRRPNVFRQPGKAGIENDQLQEDMPKSSEEIFSQKTAFDTFDNKRTDAPLIVPNGIQVTQPISTSDFRENKYYGPGNQYLPPQSNVNLKKFPSQFENKDISWSLSPNSSIQGSTARPFMTSNVFDDDDSNRRSSFSRNPFSSPGITKTTTEGNYPNYSDIDYSENNENDRLRTSSTRVPLENTGSTSRPYQITQTTTKPYQYSPNEDVLVTKNETPGSRTPDYSIISTTGMPIKNSRFVPTQSTRKPTPSGYRPPSSTVIPDIANKISNLAPSQNDFGIGRPNLSSGTPSNDGSIFGARLPTSNRKGNSQRYPSSTLRPTTKYNTVRPSSSTQGLMPSSISDTLSSQTLPNTYEIGYHYGSGISSSGYPSAGKGSRAGFTNIIPSGPGMYSQVPPGSAYQSDYQYGPVPDFARPSAGAVLSNRPNLQSPAKDGQLPNVYQSGYQYGPVSGLPSSTVSPTTGQFISSENPESLIPDYSAFQPNIEGSGLVVDNFGRPIYAEEGSYPGYSNTQDTGIPPNQERNVINVSPGQAPNVSDKSSGNVPDNNFSLPEYYGTTERIIGENFSGPKQPQRFDPETGYHY